MDKLATPTKKTFPQIYVFEDRHEPGWLKVGETTQEEIAHIEDNIDPMGDQDDQDNLDEIAPVDFEDGEEG